MITADQLLSHAVGDYVLQSHWMATEKTKRSTAALCHVLTYMLPFLFLRPSLPALVVIVGTHFVIDRWRLARFVVWAKNWICPFWLTRVQFLHTNGSTSNAFAKNRSVITEDGLLVMDKVPKDVTAGSSVSFHALNPTWEKCKATGYDPEVPAWLAVWLLIIVDNIMHIAINGLALKYL